MKYNVKDIAKATFMRYGVDDYEVLNSVLTIFKNKINLQSILTYEYGKDIDSSSFDKAVQDKIGNITFLRNIKNDFVAKNFDSDYRNDFVKLIANVMSVMMMFDVDEAIIEDFSCVREFIITDRVTIGVMVDDTVDILKLKKSDALFYGAIYFLILNIDVFLRMSSSLSKAGLDNSIKENI